MMQVACARRVPKVKFSKGDTPFEPPFRVSPQRVRGRRVRVIIGLTRLREP